MGTCAGCGQDASTHVELFPGIDVYLCEGRATEVLRTPRGGRSHDYYRVSATCLRKARACIAACPGCGAAKHAPGTLCRECRDLLMRGRELSAERGEIRWYALNFGGFLPHLGHAVDGDKARERFGRLLMRACAAGRFSERLPDAHVRWIGNARAYDSGHVSCPAAEMSSAQAEAAEELLQLLRPLMELYRLDGEDRGSSILRRLARGDLTTSQLDSTNTARAAQVAEAQAKLEKEEG